MRKRLLLTGGLAVYVVVLAPLLLPLFHRPSPGVTRENFLRMHQGMTEEEIEAILGCPSVTEEELSISLVPRCRRIWKGNEGVITIWFTAAPGREVAFVGRFSLDYPEEVHQLLEEREHRFYLEGDLRLPEKPEPPLARFRRRLGL